MTLGMQDYTGKSSVSMDEVFKMKYQPQMNTAAYIKHYDHDVFRCKRHKLLTNKLSYLDRVNDVCTY